MIRSQAWTMFDTARSMVEGARRVPRWSTQQEDLIQSVLIGLLKQAGGRITLTEDELGDDEDRLVINVEEAAGIVVIDLIPDFVKTEEAEKVNPWEKLTGTVTGVPLTFTTSANSGTITYKLDLT